MPEEREYAFTGTFTVIAANETEARRKLNRCFPTSKKRLDEAKARYYVELTRVEAVPEPKKP
jgi:hypothetical protein